MKQTQAQQAAAKKALIEQLVEQNVAVVKKMSGFGRDCRVYCRLNCYTP